MDRGASDRGACGWGGVSCPRAGGCAGVGAPPRPPTWGARAGQWGERERGRSEGEDDGRAASRLRVTSLALGEAALTTAGWRRQWGRGGRAPIQFAWKRCGQQGKREEKKKDQRGRTGVLGGSRLSHTAGLAAAGPRPSGQCPETVSPMGPLCAGYVSAPCGRARRCWCQKDQTPPLMQQLPPDGAPAPPPFRRPPRRVARGTYSGRKGTSRTRPPTSVFPRARLLATGSLCEGGGGGAAPAGATRGLCLCVCARRASPPRAGRCGCRPARRRWAARRPLTFGRALLRQPPHGISVVDGLASAANGRRWPRFRRGPCATAAVPSRWPPSVSRTVPPSRARMYYLPPSLLSRTIANGRERKKPMRRSAHLPSPRATRLVVAQAVR